MTGRLILDITSLLRWSGPPAGIPRVEHALATAALRRPGAMLACFDPGGAGMPGRLRALNPAWQDVLLSWSGMLDRHQPAARTGLGRFRPGRQGAVAALERLRLTARQPAVAGLAGLAQRAVLYLRPHGFVLYDADGARFANVPRDLGLAEEVEPRPGDALLSAGNAWFDSDPARLAALWRRPGLRSTVLCYDLIPITHPRFYQPEVVRQFRDHWRAVLPMVDQVIVNAACIGEDLRRFCQAENLAIPAVAQIPLGYDPPRSPSAMPSISYGLQPGSYALFVSTIEPRKGHAMLLRAWRRLLARGIPQRAGFRLVFVGRPGWMVDAVLRDLQGGAGLGGTVLHLDQASDTVLEALYSGAAFCLYPSVYEGFGLPVIEAFARGKPVLASTGGAVAETAGALCPCLDPLDDAAWAAAMEAWITDEAERARYADAVRTGFARPDWPEAAARILDAAAG